VRQTLFFIPAEVAGYPLFGWGLFLAVWALASLGLLAILVRRQGFNRETLSYLPLLGLAGLIIRYVLPALAETQGLPVRGYGVMLLAGSVAGIALSIHRARRRGVDPTIIHDLAVWMFISGMLGARLFYVIEYWPQYQRGTWMETLFALVNLAQGGLVVYGSVFAAGLALWAFVRARKLPGLALADLIAPSMLLGLALGRVGCFLNGCCFGGACELPWAVRFPFGSPPHVRQVQEDKIYVHGLKIVDVDGRPVVEAVEPNSPAAAAGLKPGAQIMTIDDEPVHSAAEAHNLLLQIYGAGRRISIVADDSPQVRSWELPAVAERSLPIHPTQLYSTLDAVLICLFLLAYDPFRRRDGELTALMMTIYPVTRFLMEIIRTDESPVFGTHLSISQNVSLIMLALAAALWLYLSRQPKRLAWPAA
jgi:phosphatidylglycerol---prolipoprotein diacylglyceryl transferase